MYRRSAVVCLQRREGGGVAKKQPQRRLPSRILEHMPRHLGQSTGVTETAQEGVKHTVPGLSSGREVAGEGVPEGRRGGGRGSK
jgi:hypothetical protein